ncbi:MAG: hypothetical protein HYW23_00465 [Candidatus Aenigmarchaeota archaeon]|nr:hypothetical protein [Candidatus Aenigmarchaeota archaeon]
MEDRLLYNGNKLSLDYFDNLLKQNIWKAFATIHAGIHHQMKIILRYKFNKDENDQPLGNHPEKWNIVNKKYFAPLAKDLFILGIIKKDFEEEILRFNSDRNDKLGHINIYESAEPSDDEIKQICLNGVEIVKELDKIIHDTFFTQPE